MHQSAQAVKTLDTPRRQSLDFLGKGELITAHRPR
jgi:hypothetical protein